MKKKTRKEYTDIDLFPGQILLNLRGALLLGCKFVNMFANICLKKFLIIISIRLFMFATQKVFIETYKSKEVTFTSLTNNLTSVKSP